jgi:hypothetical protein
MVLRKEIGSDRGRKQGLIDHLAWETGGKASGGFCWLGKPFDQGQLIVHM